jgi:diguanylate cyclase (GGDEF)-like protein
VAGGPSPGPVPPAPAAKVVEAAPRARLDVVLEQWRTACLDGEGANAEPFRHAEAGAFVRAVLGSLESWDGRALEVAAAGWARSVRSLPVLNARLASLRRVLEEHTDATEGSRLEEVLGTVGALAIQAALLELENAALTDSLTGAGNRRALETAATVALAESARTGQALSIAVIDLDGLKTLNDTSGHSAGDAALEQLAEAVRGAYRATDQLFRIGGDEFVVLLPLAGGEAVAEVMARARRLGAPRFTWGSATVPDDGADLESLLAVADARLYAKRRAARYQDSRGTTGTQAALGVLPGAAATPTKPRHFARAAVVAAASAVVVAVLALVLSGSGGLPRVNTLPPAQAPASSPPPGGGAGPGSGATGPSATGQGTPGPGSPGPGTAGSGGTGASGTGSAPGTGSTGGSSGSTSVSTTVPATTPTTTPAVTVPGSTGGSTLVPGTTTTTTLPSGSGGLLGSLGGTLGNTVNNTTSTLNNTLGSTLNNVGSLLP